MCACQRWRQVAPVSAPALPTLPSAAVFPLICRELRVQSLGFGATVCTHVHVIPIAEVDSDQTFLKSVKHVFLEKKKKISCSNKFWKH